MSPLIACCTVAWVSLPSPSSSTKVCSSHPVTWKVALAVVMAPVLCLIHTYVQVWAALTQVCTTVDDGPPDQSRPPGRGLTSWSQPAAWTSTGTAHEPPP